MFYFLYLDQWSCFDSFNYQSLNLYCYVIRVLELSNLDIRIPKLVRWCHLGSPDFHKNTQLALMRHANCVLTCEFWDLDDTIVQA